MLSKKFKKEGRVDPGAWTRVGEEKPKTYVREREGTVLKIIFPPLKKISQNSQLR